MSAPLRSAIADRDVFQRILYAQCWEDPDVLASALELGPDDDVLSVASAGDNSLALLLKGPRSVTAVDLSEPQLALCELKVAGIRCLEHDEYLELLGVRPSPRRAELYSRCREALPESARTYWDAGGALLQAGLVHQGKFERYFRLFRTRLLPFVHGRRTVEALLEPRDQDARSRFYDQRWNSLRWRWLFRLFFSRALMSRLGRDASFFAHVEGSVAERFLERTRHAFTELPTHDNWFLEYIALGRYRDLDHAHPYLRPEGFRRLKQDGLLDRIRFVRGELEGLLPASEPGTFSAFNLSDVFEYMDEATTERLYEAIVAAARPGARIALWNLLVPREAPLSLGGRIERHPERSKALHRTDRAWFYDRFVLETVAA